MASNDSDFETKAADTSSIFREVIVAARTAAILLNLRYRNEHA